MLRKAAFVPLIYGGEALGLDWCQRFAEPRCYTTIATIATVTAAAVSLASVGYAAAQGAPQIPGGPASSREVADAQANALPWQRAMAAAEQEGGQAVRWGYTQTTMSASQRAGLQSQLDQVNAQIQKAKAQPQQGGGSAPFGDLFATQDLEGKRNALTAQLAAIPQGGGTAYLNTSTGQYVPASEAVADFHGFGTADVEGSMAKKMADIQTQLAAKYGVAFTKQARAEAQQADPLGFAARDEEQKLIEQQIKNPMPINPLSTSLDQQVKQRLDAGSGLTPMSQDLLDQAMARANADRAGGTSSADVAGEMSTGTEGAARRQAGTRQAQSWLSSGATPEDVNYRREQQNLADLSSFISGQTPQSQFKTLSGAAQGATPFYGGQPLPGQPGNASTVGPAFGVAAWQQQVRGMGSQANSWMAGLSSLLGGVGTAAKALG